MDEVEEFVRRSLDVTEMNVKFDREVWSAEREDGEWQYGSHIIELSGKRSSKT